MNCTQARRFLYAFADGEFGVKDNCEVLDHLKMCPACTRIVADQQALRAALASLVASEPLPPVAPAKLLAAIQPGRQNRLTRRMTVWIPAAAAAALLLLAGLRLQSWWLAHAASPRGAAPQTVANGTQSITGRVLARHLRCSAFPPDQHQARDLPASLAALRDQEERLAGDLNVDVRVPDLTDFGYTFASAGHCGIDADCTAGLHLIYTSCSDQTPLSVFSVPRLDHLPCRQHCRYGNEPRFIARSVVTETDYAVAGCHSDGGNATYFVCGACTPDEANQLLRQVQLAAAGRTPTLAAAVTTHAHP